MQQEKKLVRYLLALYMILKELNDDYQLKI